MSLPFSSCPQVISFSDTCGTCSPSDLRIPKGASALIYHCNAEVIYEFESDSYIAHAGSVLLLPPDLPYRATTEEKATVILIAYFNALPPSTTKPEILFLPINKKIRESFLQFAYLAQSAELGRELAMMATFYTLLYQLHRYNKDADAQVRQNDLIRPSVAYLEKHYTARGLSMREVAALSGISETHFRALFSRQHGCTPSQFIAEKRIQKAAFLLEKDELSTEEIAHLCGFSELHYFSKCFEKRMGKKPEEYRESQTKKPTSSN